MPKSLYCQLAFCILLILLTVSAGQTLEQTPIGDIQNDPLRFQDIVVKVVGEVVKVESDSITPGAGTYTILDSSDSPITVRTRNRLPKSGDRIYVVGTVYRDDQQSKPYIEEWRKGRAAPSLKLLVGAAGALALIAFVLIYLLMWHRPEKPKSTGIPNAPARKPVVTQVFQDDPVAILTAISGPHKGQTFNIYPGLATIGRDDDRTVHLSEDQTVSRQQARILAEDGVVTLFNESSTNPTRIDGKSVEKVELTDGSLIQIGASKLRVSVLEH